MNLEQEAREFLDRKLAVEGMKPGIEWYPRVDVLLQWHQSFARQQVEARDRQIERYRAALEHYAKRDSWQESDWNNPDHLENVYIGQPSHGYDAALDALTD